MASPVDTTVKHFSAQMEGAPAIPGQASSLLGVLEACLVTGFGLKPAVSLVVASGVATLTFSTTHAATLDSVILVAGVSGALSGLNGEQKVTALAPNQVKFATSEPDGTAAGSITVKMAPAGWEKVFSDTNIAVYRSPLPESTRKYLRIDDTGTTTARIRGYESMTGVSTGTGPFPTNSQLSGGGYISKSAMADSVAADWSLVANARTILFSARPYARHQTQQTPSHTMLWGDFEPFATGGDPHAFAVSSGTDDSYDNYAGAVDYATGDNTYTPRAHHGMGGSFKMRFQSETGSNGAGSGVDSFFGPFPNTVDGALRLSRRFLVDLSTREPRGVVPGLYTVPQSKLGLVFSPGDRQAGGGPLAGRILLAKGCGHFSHAYPNEGSGISFVDITGPWNY